MPRKRRKKEVLQPLPEDILMIIFDQLPLKQRVRFERVNKKWAQALRRIWNNTTRIKFESGPVDDFEECRHLSHRFHYLDRMVDDSDSVLSSRRLSFRLLQRCPNLRSVHFGSHPMVTNFGEQLFKYCPKLEHVSFKDIITFAAFIPYATSAPANSCRITCLVIDTDDDDLSRAEQSVSEKLQTFVKACPLLETFVNMSETNTKSMMFSLASRPIKDLRIGTFFNLPEIQENNDVSVNDEVKKTPWVVEVLRKFDHLERFNCFEGLSSTELRILLNLPKLTEVGLVLNPCAIQLLNNSKCKWTSVSLDAAGDSADLPFTQISSFLSRLGQQLKFLRLVQCPMTRGELETLCQWCPNLEDLEIIGSEPIIFTNHVVDCLTSLRSLRKLILASCEISDTQFHQLISGLLFLRELHLFNIDVSDAMKESLNTIYRHRPWSQLLVYLDHRLQPDDVNYREVNGNVIYFYSH